MENYPYRYLRMKNAGISSDSLSSQEPYDGSDLASVSSSATARSFNGLLDSEKRGERKATRYGLSFWRRRSRTRSIVFWVFCGWLATVVGVLLWLILIFTVPRNNKPASPPAGINSVVEEWRTPADSLGKLSPWPANFTRDIVPLDCHSHNDYWRKVPMYEALAAGCKGIEADIWVNDKTKNGSLLVGHMHLALSADRTLESLYIKPLLAILQKENNLVGDNQVAPLNPAGVYESSPNTTITLFLDFKQEGKTLWPYVNQQLETLRAGNWLSHWDNSTNQMVWRPLIVVGSGDAPFDLIVSDNKYQDIFYDAPLDDITNPKYNASNSYYASVSMYKSLGLIWGWKFSSKQLDKMKFQINAAKAKGLVPRYWGAPEWPWKLNDYIWGVEIENGIGLLNTDIFSSEIFYPLITRFGKNRLTW